jgi:hypothetical protein
VDSKASGVKPSGRAKKQADLIINPNSRGRSDPWTLIHPGGKRPRPSACHEGGSTPNVVQVAGDVEPYSLSWVEERQIGMRNVKRVSSLVDVTLRVPP